MDPVCVPTCITARKGNADNAIQAIGGSRGGAWVGTADYYMAAGADGGCGGSSSSEASAAKAKIFFELWEEDKSMPL